MATHLHTILGRTDHDNGSTCCYLWLRSRRLSSAHNRRKGLRLMTDIGSMKLTRALSKVSGISWFFLLVRQKTEQLTLRVLFSSSLLDSYCCSCASSDTLTSSSFPLRTDSATRRRQSATPLSIPSPLHGTLKKI